MPPAPNCRNELISEIAGIEHLMPDSDELLYIYKKDQSFLEKKLPSIDKIEKVFTKRNLRILVNFKLNLKINKLSG